MKRNKKIKINDVKYEIIKNLGEGGFSYVFLVRSTKDKKNMRLNECL